jgi:spermidine/putrescine transport system permease protein
MVKRTAQLAYIGPVVAYLLLFFLLPLVLVVLISFTTRGPYGQTVYDFTLENYARFLDPLYLKVLWRTVLFGVGTTLTCLVMSYPLAFYLARQGHRKRDRLLMLLMIPFWSNFLVRTYAWIIILKTEGLLNQVLMALGIIHRPLEMMYTQGAVVLGYIYTWLPFMILPLYVSMEKLDKRLLEAAKDLGANSLMVFLRIVIPLTAPGAIAGTILVLIPALGMFAITDLMGGAKTVMLGNLIQNQFGAARNWQFGSAVSCVLLLLTVIALYAMSGKSKSIVSLGTKAAGQGD